MTLRDEYNDHVDNLEAKHIALRKKKPFEAPPFFSVILGIYIRKAALKVWAYRITAFWAIFFAVALRSESKAIVLSFWLIFLMAHLGAFFFPFMKNLCAIIGDGQRNENRARRIAEGEELYYNKYGRAQDFIRSTKLVPEDDIPNLKSYIEEDENRIVLHWRDQVDGRSEEDIAPVLVKQRRFFKAIRAEVREDDDMFLDVIFFKKDPLNESHRITSPRAVDLTDMSVDAGVLSDGEHYRFCFKDIPVSIIGGTSGAGKTVAVSSVLSAYAAMREDVELHVIDNKGGSDWKAFEAVSRTYMAVNDFDYTIDDVYEFAEGLEKERARRMRESFEKLGTSNYWNATPEKRREAGMPFLLVVLDEAHMLFDKTGREREELDKIAKMTKIFTILSKMGRSSGIHVMFITQKPTSDAIPSSITNQAGLRVALRVNGVPAEESILGPSPEGELNIPRAFHIPKNRKGGAVFADDEERRWMGRFFFFDEDDQIAYLNRLAQNIDTERESNFLKELNESTGDCVMRG